MKICHKCGREVDVKKELGRKEACPSVGPTCAAVSTAHFMIRPHTMPVGNPSRKESLKKTGATSVTILSIEILRF